MRRWPAIAVLLLAMTTVSVALAAGPGPSWQRVQVVSIVRLPLAHVAADQSGRAVVVWGAGRLVGTRNRVEGDGVFYATRSRSGRLSRPRKLAPAPYSTTHIASDLSGHVVLTATRAVRSCGKPICPERFWASFGTTTGHFSRLGSFATEDAQGSNLAVGGRGTAVAAFARGTTVRYYLRRPGGTFGRAHVIRESTGIDPNSVGAAVAPDGRVLLAWVAGAGSRPELKATVVSAGGKRGRIATLLATGDFRAPRAAFDGRGAAVVAVSSGIGSGDTHAFVAPPRGRFGHAIPVPIRFATRAVGSPRGGFAIAGDGPADATRFTSILVARIGGRGNRVSTSTLSGAGLGPWITFDAAGGLHAAWGDRSGPVLTSYFRSGATTPSSPQAVPGDDAGYLDIAGADAGRAFGLWTGSSTDAEPIHLAHAG